MSPEEKELLDQTFQLSKENNQLLRSIHRSARVQTIMRALYWFVIIGLSFGAFYFIQPYLDNLKQYAGAGSGVQGLNLKDLLEQAKTLQQQ